MKPALTIAGSASCGGAGIQADLKTFAVLEVYGMSAITAVTAQNTLGVKQSFTLSPDLVRAQIDAAANDISADACKTGMLATAAIIDVVEDAIRASKLQPYVCDPVISSRARDVWLGKGAIDTLKRKLFPLAAVIIPT